MGLWEQLSKGNVTEYDPRGVTMADFKRVLRILVENRPPLTTTFMTDQIGYELMKLHPLLYNIKYWWYVPKRGKRFIYVSLFQKHGLLKLKIHLDGDRDKKFEFFYGTTSLGRCDETQCLNVIKQYNEYLP